MKTPTRINLGGLVIALALFCSPALKAQFFSFNVDLNTAALSGDPYSPFFLDFQLNKGSGSLPSSVTLSNFLFTGGTALGSPVFTGNASGSFASSVSLNASAIPFNEFYQGFTTGTTDIKFTATFSQNFTGLMPTGFAAAILDNAPTNLMNPGQIWTNAPDTVSLVTLDLGATNGLNDVGVFSSTAPSPAGVTATVTAIPEPSAYAVLMGISALSAGLHRRLRRTSAQINA